MLYDKKWDQPAEPAKAKPIEPWRQVLLDAADLLDKDGWCQGAFHNIKGEHCAAGAIEYKSLSGPTAFQARCRLIKHLNIHFPITSWNDSPRRTKEQVTAAMREAAKSY